MMKLYHRTDFDSAQAIIREGFRDGVGTYLTRNNNSGVFLSDRPLDEGQGAHGDTLPRVTVNLTAKELANYEWKEDFKPYREFCIPASFVNAHSTVKIVDRHVVPDWMKD